MQNCQNMTKYLQGKKVYIFAKDIGSKRIFEIKAKKMFAWKRPIFWVILLQAVVSKTLRHFNKIRFCLQNISTLKKISLFPLLRAEINVGAIMPPPLPVLGGLINTIYLSHRTQLREPSSGNTRYVSVMLF